MTQELTPLPDITYVSGQLSLRLLDVKVMDHGVLSLEVHLSEAIRQSVGEFFRGVVDTSESADVVGLTLQEVHETFLDENDEEIVSEIERKVARGGWSTTTSAA